MEKSFREKLLDIKRQESIGYVNFNNDGSVSEDSNGYAETMNDDRDAVKGILKTFFDATRSYTHYHEFDEIDMNLVVGLIFKKEDTEDGKIKEGARPIDNIVRFYTGSVKSYLDGEQTNTADYYTYGLGRQGYVDYNKLISGIEAEGLEFIGPTSFEEFKAAIKYNGNFDIIVRADLQEKKEKPIKLGLK